MIAFIGFQAAKITSDTATKPRPTVMFSDQLQREGGRQLGAAEAGHRTAEQRRDVADLRGRHAVGDEHLGALTGGADHQPEPGAVEQPARPSGPDRIARYVSGSWSNRIGPKNGMSDSTGIGTAANALTPWPT